MIVLNELRNLILWKNDRIVVATFFKTKNVTNTQTISQLVIKYYYICLVYIEILR